MKNFEKVRSTAVMLAALMIAGCATFFSPNITLKPDEAKRIGVAISPSVKIYRNFDDNTAPTTLGGLFASKIDAAGDKKLNELEKDLMSHVEKYKVDGTDRLADDIVLALQESGYQAVKLTSFDPKSFPPDPTGTSKLDRYDYDIREMKRMANVDHLLDVKLSQGIYGRPNTA